jgi:hypothetical protein
MVDILGTDYTDAVPNNLFHAIDQRTAHYDILARIGCHGRISYFTNPDTLLPLTER